MGDASVKLGFAAIDFTEPSFEMASELSGLELELFFAESQFLQRARLRFQR